MGNMKLDDYSLSTVALHGGHSLSIGRPRPMTMAVTSDTSVFSVPPVRSATTSALFFVAQLVQQHGPTSKVGILVSIYASISVAAFSV